MKQEHKNTKAMDTFTNRFGEKQTDWTSHKHPENPNFMQVVKYMHIEREDGKSDLYWSVANSAANDKHCIRNISLSEAQTRYTDAQVVELTEADFQKWLNK
jgi:hypothetical protein